MKTYLDTVEEEQDKKEQRLRMAELGRMGRGEAKRRAPEHYRVLSELATEGRRKAAREKPGWNAERMAKAWATRRARGG